MQRFFFQKFALVSGTIEGRPIFGDEQISYHSTSQVSLTTSEGNPHQCSLRQLPFQMLYFRFHSSFGGDHYEAFAEVVADLSWSASNQAASAFRPPCCRLWLV